MLKTIELTEEQLKVLKGLLKLDFGAMGFAPKEQKILYEIRKKLQ